MCCNLYKFPKLSVDKKEVMDVIVPGEKARRGVIVDEIIRPPRRTLYSHMTNDMASMEI
jgi:hypothetical protein